MAQINLTIDDEIKEQADSLFTELGMSFSTAINIFVKQTLRQRGIPFSITVTTDPFYNPANMERLAHSIRQMERGEVVKKTIEELEKMENA
jgi:DNA-damage-inducible protein J